MEVSVALLFRGVGLRRPFGAVIVMVVQRLMIRDQPLVAFCYSCRARA